MKLIDKLDMYLEACSGGDKKKSKGKGKGLGKGKGEGPIGKPKMDETDIPKAYMNDPLYKAVITSKNQKEYDKAVKTLKGIRGETAFNNFVRMLKK